MSGVNIYKTKNIGEKENLLTIPNKVSRNYAIHTLHIPKKTTKKIYIQCSYLPIEESKIPHPTKYHHRNITEKQTKHIVTTRNLIISTSIPRLLY